MTSSSLLRATMALFVLGGCGDDRSSGPLLRESGSGNREKRERPAPKPREPKPLEVEWNVSAGQRTGTIKGGGKIELLGYQGGIAVTLRDVRKGTSWKISDQKGTTDSDYPPKIDVPVADQLGAFTVEELKKFDAKLTLELELPDGRAGSTELPPIDVSYMIDEMLLKAENGPVLFGQEPEDPKRQDSIAWPRGLIGKRFIGKAGKLHEIDWVLVVTKLPDEKGRKVCGGYTDNAGKRAPDLTIVLKETEAVIYDRRTGEVAHKKVFAPDKACPMFTFRNEGEDTSDSSIPYGAVESWARSLIKR